jgi:hypothetical protein
MLLKHGFQHIVRAELSAHGAGVKSIAIKMPWTFDFEL